MNLGIQWSLVFDLRFFAKTGKDSRHSLQRCSQPVRRNQLPRFSNMCREFFITYSRQFDSDPAGRRIGRNRLNTGSVGLFGLHPAAVEADEAAIFLGKSAGGGNRTHMILLGSHQPPQVQRGVDSWSLTRDRSAPPAPPVTNRRTLPEHDFRFPRTVAWFRTQVAGSVHRGRCCPSMRRPSAGTVLHSGRPVQCRIQGC